MNIKKMNLTKNQLLYYSGKLISNLGTQLYYFVLSIYVLSVTGSALSYAFTLSLGIIITLIFGPVSAVICDKVNKKVIMVAADFLNAFILFLFFILSVISGEFTLYNVYISVILINIIGTFFDTASESGKIEIADKSQMLEVNSACKVIDSFTRIISPILAAGIYTAAGINSFLLIDGISFFISALFGIFIRFNSYQAENKEIHIVKDWMEGIKYINRQDGIKAVIILFLAFNVIFSLEMSVLLPYLVLNYFVLSSSQYAVIETCTALGLLGGAFLINGLLKKAHIKKIIKKIIYCLIVILASFLLTVQLKHQINGILLVMILSVGMFLYGNTVSCLEIPLQTLVQCKVEQKFLARVLLTIILCVKIFNPVVLIIGGYLLDVLSPAIIIVIGIILLSGVWLALAKMKGEFE
ncbi:MFS transporter [Anaerocolumna xylanovorans]|uniref:Na+/melibiose symporter n=1 Tax=Anaerocolumna xylanovorans DSM 12503 TaxID=1121345 RepID=A0A1M7YEB6_9FIRM|nr:MFS transporter [Anaerocolumna xylanovorans]SHO50977.1 Na+/melibiose symporter [Anaerocolumna xylanovorans DSM 12503]